MSFLKGNSHDLGTMIIWVGSPNERGTRDLGDL